MNKITKFTISKTLIITLIFTLLFGSCSQWSTTDISPAERHIANVEIEKIIEEFKSYYDGSVSDARKSEIKTIQENLLKYLIEATSSTDAQKVEIYKRANNYFNKTYPLILENLTNEKAGLEKFNEIKKAPLWTLKEELRYLDNELKKLPAPKLKIDLIKGLTIVSSFYRNMDIDESAMNTIVGQYEIMGQKVLGNNFNLMPSFTELEEIVNTDVSEDKRTLKVINLVASKIQVHEKRIRNLGKEISNGNYVDMKNKQIMLVMKFVEFYFNKLDDDVIKTILSELVTSRTKLVEEEVIKIVLRNTGPALGKVLQHIGKDAGVGPQFSKLLEMLESSGKTVPLHLVKEVVARDNGGYEFREILKEVGTGTMAQVNEATIFDKGVEKQTALRIKKPGIEVRCKDDIRVMRSFITLNEDLFKEEGIEDVKTLVPLIESVEKFLNEEMDFSLAVERQLKAYEIYSRSIKLSGSDKFDLLEMKVPSVYLPPSGKSDLHVQEFASGGVKFAKLSDTGTKKIIAQEMVRMWFEEALFRSGFLNADLHQGNFRIVLVEEDKKIKILLYDFGFSTTLSKDEQRAFLLIGSGAYMKSPKVLVDGLLISMNKQGDSKLRARLRKEVSDEMKKNPQMMAEDWVKWCVSKQYFVSENLGAFGKGSLLVRQLPESMGEADLFKDVLVKTAIRNLKLSYSDRDYNYPLKKIDMLKIAKAGVGYTCKDMVAKFFRKKQ